MTTLLTLSEDQLAHSVFQVMNGECDYLPVNKKLSLEYLSLDQDGIFPSRKSWESFVRGNFLYNSTDFRGGVKESTIKKWCHPVIDYSDSFVVKIGNDKYHKISADDIVLEYDYEWYSSKDAREGFNCTAVQIFITAKIK